MTASKNIRYPFSPQSSNHPAIEFHKRCQNAEELARYKLKIVLLQEMRSTYIINLIKSSVEGTTINFLYEYEPLSLIQYLKTHLKKQHSKLSVSLYQSILNQFTQYLINLTSVLTHYQVKTYLSLSQIAVAQERQDIKFRYFIDPDVEFMALEMPCKHDTEIKIQIAKNRQELSHFYDKENHRIVKQFQNILESTFKDVLDSQNANLIIDGPSLIVLSNPPAKKHRKHQRSYSDEKDQLSQPKKYQYTQTMNYVKDLKAKYQNKLSQIKNQLKTLEDKLHQKEKKRKQRNNSMCEDLRHTNHGQLKYPQKESDTQRIPQNSENHKEDSKNPEENHIQNHECNQLLVPGSKLKYKMTIITEQDIEIEKVNKNLQIKQISKGKIRAIKEGELTQNEVYAICNSTMDDNLNTRASTDQQSTFPTYNRNSDTHALKNITRINSRSPDEREVEYYEDIVEQRKKKSGQLLRKVSNIENFGDKVREAKLKAERLIKRYALNKK